MLHLRSVPANQRGADMPTTPASVGTTRRGEKLSRSAKFPELNQNTLETALASMPFYGGDGGDETPGTGQETPNSGEKNIDSDANAGDEKNGSTSSGGMTISPCLTTMKSARCSRR